MHPILFELPFLRWPVYAYGTMLYLSFVLGWILTLRLGEREGLPRGRMEACFLVTALTALAGARMLYVAANAQSFHHLPDVFDVSRGGVVAYGGFLGGLLGSIVFCRRARLPLLTWADCAMPALCTGLALTRVGCLLAGCDFGKPWDGPWAVAFPPGSPAFAQHVTDGVLSASAAASLHVHPTQVYESLAGMLLLGLILYARRYRRAQGEALAAFALGYAVLRSLIETLRADPQRGFVGPLSTSQWIAVVTFVAGLTLLARLRGAAVAGVPRRVRPPETKGASMRKTASLTFAVAVVSSVAGGVLFAPDSAHTEDLAKIVTGQGTTTCGECVSDGFLSGMKECKTVYPDGTVVITTYACTLPKKDDGDTLPLAPPAEPTRPPTVPQGPSGPSTVK